MPTNKILFLSFDDPSSEVLSIKFTPDNDISDMKRQLKKDLGRDDLSLADLEFWRVKPPIKAQPTLEGQLGAFQGVRIEDVAEHIRAPGDDASLLKNRLADDSTIHVLYRVRRFAERADDMVGREEGQDVVGEMRARTRMIQPLLSANICSGYKNLLEQARKRKPPSEAANPWNIARFRTATNPSSMAVITRTVDIIYPLLLHLFSSIIPYLPISSMTVQTHC